MVRVDKEQVDRFAAWLRSWGGATPFDFCLDGTTDLFPAAGSAGVVDLFFANAAHQFGFWTAGDGRYDRPMVAALGGQERKGSDYLFACFYRAWQRQADCWAPARMAARRDEEWAAVFADDQGRNPLPMWREHARILLDYAAWFIERDTTPAEIVTAANAAERPLAAFLDVVGEVPGYREDPLRKKLMLLAVMLENRPEGFLRVSDPASAVPIIDYHLQRSALRTGLVVFTDAAAARANQERRVVEAEVEAAIRQATYAAIERLVRQSGLSVAAVDYFFFMNRRRCPEMTPPQCAVCPAQPVCARRTEAFQPVYRTEAY